MSKRKTPKTKRHEAKRGRKAMRSDEDLLNLAETARELRISTRTLQTWVTESPPRLPFYRWGEKAIRFEYGDIKAFKQNNKVGARPSNAA